ncbi:MAG: uroporphyrinogen-III C-methyltransferase [Deltaproteobacteria bacterium]
MNVKYGTVYIVGAGPGDPRLITVRGLDILKKADCILYDFLSTPRLLRHAKRGCARICVGKKDGLHLKEQEEINALLLESARRHAVVVRLKGGDPFVFSRGIEEALFLEGKGVRVEVVPGVTSAIAGPASFGIPLTVKDKITSVAFVAGRRKDPRAAIEAPACGTLVYLMAVANIRRVVEALRRSGRPEDTPCAFIERATRASARMVRATLATLEDETRRQAVRPPAVLVVGEGVRYA